MNEITKDAISRIWGMNEYFNYMLMEETSFSIYLFYAIISFIVIFLVFKAFSFSFYLFESIKSTKIRYSLYILSTIFAICSILFYILYINSHQVALKDKLNSIRRENQEIIIYNQFKRDEIRIKKDNIKDIKIKPIEHVHKRSTLNLIMGSHEKTSHHCEISIKTDTETYKIHSFSENMHKLRLPSCW